MPAFAYFSLIIIVIGAIVFGLFLIFRHIRRRHLAKSLNLQLLSIRLPQKTKPEEKEKDFKDEINLSAQLFGILSGLKSYSAMEVAVHHIGGEICFYIAVPRESKEAVSRQIEGLWKDAQVQLTNDYNIFNSNGLSEGIYIQQNLSYVLPIRTYVESGVDTFGPILSGLSKIKEIGEGVAVQILIGPSPKTAKKSIVHMIESLKKGFKLKDVLKSGSGIGLRDIKKALLASKENEIKEKQEKIIDEEAIKTLEAKISKPLVSVNLRVLASAATKPEVDSILEGIWGSFIQFNAPLRQELKVFKPRSFKKLIYQFCFREFDDAHAMILNTEELASLFHLPLFSSDVPRIAWVKSKEAAPPVNLPDSGTLIGESFFRGEREPVYITNEDRRRHVYIVGQTGTGKSTLMVNMVIEDIKAGKGVGIIDPHGELIEKILELIPESRIDDVVLFDPSDRWRPAGLNMLEYDFNRPEQKTFIVNEMQGIFNKLFLAETMGPMFEQYMRNALLLLMEDAQNEPPTLMEVARIFTDVEFRQRKLARITNPIVIDFWEKEAIKAGGEAALANMTPYITSKFSNFTSNDYMRPIIGQKESAFNFRQIMDEGKILLVNLSKGRIGDINANLLGMVIVGKILMGALSRVDVHESKRKDFSLYIDEFQNFTTDSIATILSEARKYGLNLIMAHQFIAQLTEKIRDAVFGNVGSIISFRVGAQDAESLVKQFEPIFSQNDLINIDNFNAYAKLLINGTTSKPFNIKTLRPEKGSVEKAEKIKQICKLKYGRDRQEVEEEILRRLRG
ncbi:type IV secretory system conjugative DNA transfer family protein [Candidatus Wolfebacteria bacterium]|nr:type IV secretory system conjugative DNA transfer family protein [Candidatus Wolfebacteria bacterium]